MYNSAISNSNRDVQKSLVKVEYLNITNVVNIKVDEFIKWQPHGGSNHLLSAKNPNRERENHF